MPTSTAIAIAKYTISICIVAGVIPTVDLAPEGAVDGTGRDECNRM
jgi:hypothetical protein